MIKGGGGALTREKIVVSACERFVCIVDDSKLVDVLGGVPLPVEVLPIARELVSARLRAIGGEPTLRAGFVTDSGNVIFDVEGLSIHDPAALEREIGQWPGVVTCGLFTNPGADVALVASSAGVQRLERSS